MKKLKKWEEDWERITRDEEGLIKLNKPSSSNLNDIGVVEDLALFMEEKL